MTPAPVDLIQIFERAPRLAERLGASAERDPDAIVAAARAELGRMSEAERIAVLNAHPRIGADAGTLSQLSRREQGVDDDPATLRELSALNDEYERKFGFRFVVFVAGRRKAEIVPIARRRLQRDRATELAAGIEEFLAISLDRLRKAQV